MLLNVNLSAYCAHFTADFANGGVTNGWQSQQKFANAFQAELDNNAKLTHTKHDLFK